MNRLKKTFFFFAGGIFIALFFFSCQKDETNFEKTKSVNLDLFHTIEVNSPYDIFLVQDTFCGITISGSEKEIDKTTLTVSDSVLKLETGHAGQFIHPHRRNMLVYIHVPNLKRINIHETCKIVSEDPIGHGTDEIGVVVDTKLAELDLNLACKTFYYWNNPNGTEMKLTGNVQELKIWNAGLGQVEASTLQSDYVLCVNGSLGDCSVRANQKLEYSITNKGNIYYYGNPAEIVEFTVPAGGKLIKAD